MGQKFRKGLQGWFWLWDVSGGFYHMVTGTVTAGLEWLEAGQASLISWGFGTFPNGLRVGEFGLPHRW